MDLERINSYLLSLEPEPPAFLKELRKSAEARGIPVVRPASESLIRVLTELKRPEKVLELGTAVGYSALVMAFAGAGSILTVESREEHFKEAGEHIREACMEERIRTVLSEAGAFLETAKEERQSFDFIFLDAAKGQYPVWLGSLKELLAPGGILLADNVLQGGTVAESRFTVARRDRTVHSRMREFLYLVTHDPQLVTTVVPGGDGMSISVKRRNV